MQNPSPLAAEILAWNDTVARQWWAFFEGNPAALAVPCDIYRPGTAAELLQHIVAGELRSAERLAAEPVTHPTKPLPAHA